MSQDAEADVHGRGEPVFRDDPRWEGLMAHFPSIATSIDGLPGLPLPLPPLPRPGA
ncbi:hypothetical protein ACFV9D_31325 [Streptomyces sp. NPDC059875]|uniref:hypothetical protein n=1 Tax=unclassified Streptomyces TaxID=2593676 RepID=UPI00365641ED